LRKATAVVQQRLLAAAGPETQAEIKRVLAKIATEVAGASGPRDYTAALRTIDALHASGQLNEAQLVEFANARRYEETVATLVRLSQVPIEVVDRLMTSDRPDPILILCKSAGWGWPTAKAIISHAAAPGGIERRARQRLLEFRAPVAGHRSARDPVLAGTAGQRGGWVRLFSGRAERPPVCLKTTAATSPAARRPLQRFGRRYRWVWKWRRSGGFWPFASGIKKPSIQAYMSRR